MDIYIFRNLGICNWKPALKIPLGNRPLLLLHWSVTMWVYYKQVGEYKLLSNNTITQNIYWCVEIQIQNNDGEGTTQTPDIKRVTCLKSHVQLTLIMSIPMDINCSPEEAKMCKFVPNCPQVTRRKPGQVWLTWVNRRPFSQANYDAGGIINFDHGFDSLRKD